MQIYFKLIITINLKNRVSKNKMLKKYITQQMKIIK